MTPIPRHIGPALLLTMLTVCNLSLGAPSATGQAAPALSGLDGPASDPVVYEVAAVDGRLHHLLPDGDQRLEAGDRLAGGAEVRTGWLSSADLTVPREAARFHLESRTHARLGADDPSILLVLDRGRLRALFDTLGELVGGEEHERRVETPAAILAVRGTEYGVAVGRGGATTLVVFEGVVEVTPTVTGPGEPTAPLRVRAGEAIHLRRGQPPMPPRRHTLTPHTWDRGGMPSLSAPVGPDGGADRGAGRGTPAGAEAGGRPGSGPGSGPGQGSGPGSGAGAAPGSGPSNGPPASSPPSSPSGPPPGDPDRPA